MTTTVLDSLSQSKAITVLMRRQIGQIPFHNARECLAITHLAISLDHREAVHLLIEAGARTSAFALLRPIFEALSRGLWAATCATEDQVQLAYSTGVLPKFDTIIKALDRVSEDGQAFASLKRRAWDPYSDYAHGGMRQVIRWFRNGTIAPQHNDEDVMDLLSISDLHGVQASLALAVIAGKSIDSFERMAGAIRDRMRARKTEKPSPASY